MALFGAGTTTSSTPANPTTGDTKNDVEVKDPPSDSISAIVFSPHTGGDFMAASSWDNTVSIYQIDGQGQSQRMAGFTHEKPVLDCAWSTDGSKVVGGGCDNAARLVDLGGNPNQAQQVAAHDNAVKCVEMFNHNGQEMLITGSWDKTVKYWDLRQQNPVATIQCQERVYTMSTKDKLLVVGCADRYINVINLQAPDKIYKTMQSPLKWQTRVVSCFSDATGFAVGSIEGRCAIQYVEEKDSSLNFSFKCHRQNDTRDSAKVYAVNAISFHPVHGTFSTAGADGTFHFWDKDAKHRLKGYPEVGGTISSTAFNRTGTIFAYAVSYDWSKGYSANNAQYPKKIMLHPVQTEECKPRQKAAGKR